MFLVNYLNRRITDEYFPVFEIAYIIELVILISAILLGITVLLATRQLPYHTNVQFRLACCLAHGMIYPASRIVVIWHQYFEPTEYVESVYLVICSLLQELFLGYFTSVITITGFDRFVATKAWKWYENSGKSTLLFFVTQVSVLTLVGNIPGFLLVFEHIDDIQVTVYFVPMVSLGIIVFAMVLQLNQREMANLRLGAKINRYSVARTYQIKENIAVLNLLVNMSLPLILVALPPFAFYGCYTLIPSNIGYDTFRYFCVYMYQMWLSAACVVVIGALAVYEPRLSIINSVRSANPMEDDRLASVGTNGDLYFSMLTRDLK